ncbi:hypothetical protein BDZ89DRAFT_1073872 [Hymenopellis radicata]|nr:hypothetical protein BDZ89DRAFT_1073872 [Hymenopellis radicata]
MVQGLAFVLLLLSCFSLVYCNTEIINFGVEDNTSSLEPNQFPPELNAGANEIESVILLNETVQGRDAGDLWLSLHTSGSWNAYDRFTLRISWAASYPIDFSITLYNPPDSSLERVKYAHIHAVHSGVFTPPVERASEPLRVPFTVILEPLVFGVLPLSVQPILVCLGVIVLGAALVTPKIHAVLARMAMEARKESVLKAMKRKRR